MDFKKLAQIIKQFDNVDLLSAEIESLEGNTDIETVDELTDFLSDELEYANE